MPGYDMTIGRKPFVDETNELRKPLSAMKGGLDYYAARLLGLGFRVSG